MIDANSLKQQLTPDDIISLLTDMGADYNFMSSKEIHFKSICHNSESYKLYYYIESASFYCHRCSKKWDVFALVQDVTACDFKSAIEYMCRVCHIEATYAKRQTFIDNWQSMKRFLPNSNYVEQPTVYDKEVLDLFKPYCHQSWLNDSITSEAMVKFGVGWYDRNEQVTIPVFDDAGNLVGIHGRNMNPTLVERGYKYIPVKTLNDQYKFPTSAVLYGLYQNQEAIRQTHEVCLFESPKSVLQCESILNPNNSLGLFGMNLNRHRANMILDMDVTTVNICLDRQYKEWGDDEWQLWVDKVKKIGNLFKGVATVYVVCDKEHRLQYKSSPSDNGVNIWSELYKERMRLI